MTNKTSRPTPAHPNAPSATDKSVDTQPDGYAQVKGGDAAKPGESAHDAKNTPNNTGEDD